MTDTIDPSRLSRRAALTALDLSRFPAPLAIRGIDYDGLLDARRERLAELFEAAGIPYDVDTLETDPAMILEQADAYRELLAYAAVNDAVRSVMIAFATGPDLTHLGAFFGVQRREVAAATDDAPAVMESDAEFRRRVLLAPEAFASAGPHGAYVYHALTADPRVLNADVWTPAPGQVHVAIQSREGDGLAAADLIATVRAYLFRPDIKPLTDVVTVRSVTNHSFKVDLDVYVQPGPDPDRVRDAVIDAVTKMVVSRRTPARDVPRSAIIAAATTGPVDKVILRTPAEDIARGFGEVAILQSIAVKVLIHDG